MLRWLMLLSGLGAATLAGCDGRTASPDSSGASHWLAPCVDDAECGPSMACLCGQCGFTCEGDPDSCPMGACVADACGAEAICQPLADEGAAMSEVEDRSVDEPSEADEEAEARAFETDADWPEGPAVGPDNPRGVWQFHRPSLVDANVLEIRADGTFVYTLGGCDVVECAWGEWAADAGGLRLSPPAGEAAFRWPDEFALTPVSTVWLNQSRDGVSAQVTAPDREGYTQAWLDQGLAVDCVDWSARLSDAPAEAQHCQSPAYPGL